LSRTRTVGEWFSKQFDDAVSVVEGAIASAGSPKSDVSGITLRINRAINTAGIGQAELAREIGVSRQAVNDWIKGRSVNIRPDHLFALSDALHVDARWLATGKQEHNK
jgi:DNA-binding XRE family transcriptional regulator